MKKPRTSIMVAAVAVCALAGVGAVVWLRSGDPMRRSPDEIRRALLREVRVGSRVDAVRALAVEHGWSDKLSETQLNCRDYSHDHEVSAARGATGLRSVVARVSRFDSDAHMPAFVLLCWEFDGQGALQDVLVTKGLEGGAIF
jgi:hypothetical protein